MTSIELAKNYYSCFNRQDWQGMLACLATDIRHDANQGSTNYGLEYYEKFLQHMDECYQEHLSDMVFMSNEEGNRIACEFIVNGVYKKTDSGLPPASNQTYLLPAGAFLEITNGKISRVTTYYNLALWLELISK